MKTTNKPDFTTQPAAFGLRLAILAALGLSSPALMAQEKEQDKKPDDIKEEKQDLGTVMVTASRRSTTVQDIPYNISALPGDELETLGIQDLSDVVRLVPGLHMVDTGPRSASQLNIRGLTVNALNSNDGGSTGGTVAIYLDETPVDIDLKIFDVERIEVLRGPQGTLYGAGSLGGTIRYITNKPQLGQFSTSIDTRFYEIKESSGLSNQTTLVSNLPVGEKFAVRFAGQYLDEEGFVDYPLALNEQNLTQFSPQQDVNNELAKTVRISALFDISDAVQLYAFHHVQDQFVGGRQGVNPGFQPPPGTVSHFYTPGNFVTGPYDSALRYVEPNDRNTKVSSLQLDVDVNFADLRFVTSRASYTEHGQRDQTDLLYDFEFGYEDYPQFRAFTREDVDFSSTTHELRLVSKGTEKLNWITGLYYNRIESDSSSKEFTPGFDDFAGIDPVPDDLEYYQIDNIEDTEKAVYGELGWQWTDDFQTTVGFRYFEQEQQNRTRIAFPLYDALVFNDYNINFGESTGKTKVDDTFFKFNASYYVNPDVMVYFTRSEGFRKGGANAVPAGGQVVIQPDELFYGPDTTVNYEIGTHSTFRDGTVMLNAAVYHINWDNIQVQGITTEGAIPIIKNADEAKVDGLELEATWLAFDNFKASGSLAWQNSRLSKDSPALNGQKDDQVPGVPKLQATVMFDYTQHFEKFDVNYNWLTSWTDPVLTKVESDPDARWLKGYALTDISIVLDAGNWQTLLFVDNVFDKYAITGVRDPRGPNGQGGLNFIVKPRTMGVGFRYEF